MSNNKVCTKCNEHKSHSEFNKDKSRPDGLCIYCRECSKKKYKHIYNKDKTILDGIRKRRSKWSRAKIKEIRDQKKMDAQSYSDNLTDSYIRKILISRSHIAKEDITPEMIEARRKQIREKRGQRS